MKKEINKMISKVKSLINNRKKIAVLLILLIISGFVVSKTMGNKTSSVEYQTAQAEKGTLIVSITASGQVSAANSTSVNTQASGVVTKVYVKNGQTVKVGDKIAELEPDLDGKQRDTQALASYQSAQNNLQSAKDNLFSLQSSLFTNWKTYMDLAQNSTYQNSDGTPKTDQRQLPQYMSVNDDWLFSEAKYKNQQNIINQAQTSVTASWLNYQQTSPVIFSPISGTITGLSLQEGTVLIAQSNSSGSAASQKIASIKTNAPAQISVSLAEIDVPKVKVDNKVTVTLDAFSGKTYTGKVISIDTIGAISSGVTSYPAVIALDTEATEILSNMSVQAKIITKIKDNVILIPSGAVQTINGELTVRVMKNGKVATVTVQVGNSNDTQTEITAGLNEGDMVVTNVVNPLNVGSAATQGTSPFSTFGGARGGFGGGNMRIQGR